MAVVAAAARAGRRAQTGRRRRRCARSSRCWARRRCRWALRPCRGCRAAAASQPVASTWTSRRSSACGRPWVPRLGPPLRLSRRTPGRSAWATEAAEFRCSCTRRSEPRSESACSCPGAGCSPPSRRFAKPVAVAAALCSAGRSLRIGRRRRRIGQRTGYHWGPAAQRLARKASPPLPRWTEPRAGACGICRRPAPPPLPPSPHCRGATCDELMPCGLKQPLSDCAAEAVSNAFW
mmetsp:Transcript_95817/g.249712  ORF Transcript_95817/g.249712 Transcript_95817/m.249712 type:complete len:235 (+) Transcript_95817:1391-2095(+)